MTSKVWIPPVNTLSPGSTYMPAFRSNDPIGRLTHSERRAWKSLERRTRRDHDREQMETLRSLAAEGSGVTGLRTPETRDDYFEMAPVEMIISGRRLRIARMPRRAVAALREAMSTIALVPLTAVGRYGPYWVLTFKTTTEQLVVLADRLTLLPDWGGPGAVLVGV